MPFSSTSSALINHSFPKLLSPYSTLSISTQNKDTKASHRPRREECRAPKLIKRLPKVMNQFHRLDSLPRLMNWIKNAFSGWREGKRDVLIKTSGGERAAPNEPNANKLN
jgi:hypothetical protein